jgi:hypothetical protein
MRFAELKNRVRTAGCLLVAMAMVCGGSRMMAQALPTATAPGAFITLGGTYSYFKVPYGETHLGGWGMYVDAHFRRQVGLEFEGHWSAKEPISGEHQTTYMVGPKIQLHRKMLSPYVKVLVGDGTFYFPYNYATGQYLVIAPGGGLDWNIGDHLKVRVIDYEYQDWTQFSYGTFRPSGYSFGVAWRLFNGSRRGPSFD